VNDEPSRGGWTSPQVVSVLVAIVVAFIGALLAFQRDDSAVVRSAIDAARMVDQNHEGRLSRLEAHVDRLRENERERR
jgi:hypothetical protein